MIQSGDQTLNNPIRHNWFAAGLGALLFAALTALLPSPARAQCQHWNVSGLWELRVGDEKIVLVNVQQDWQGQSARLTGTAERELTAKGAQTSKLSGINSGRLNGKLERTSFTLEVTYPGFTDRYTGKINPNTGQMEGTEADGMRPHWVSSKTFSCGGGTPSDKATTPQMPPRSSGKFKPDTTPQTPTPNAEAEESASNADESASNDTQDQHGKHKKNKKKHHHQDDGDQSQGND